MGILFIILAAICLVGLIIGFVLFLVDQGQIQRRSGEQVGADMIADQMDEDWDPSFASATKFKGTASEVSVGATASFIEIKEAAASGNWRKALPAFLILGGLSGMLVFGALAVFYFMDDKLIGGVILAVILFAVVRILIGFIRA